MVKWEEIEIVTRNLAIKEPLKKSGLGLARAEAIIYEIIDFSTTSFASVANELLSSAISLTSTTALSETY